MAKTFLWIEDRKGKASYIFWGNFMKQLYPDVIVESKKNTENAIITQQRTSLVMQTGVSAQQITKTQDKDASEVIRRVRVF